MCKCVSVDFRQIKVEILSRTLFSYSLTWNHCETDSTLLAHTVCIPQAPIQNEILLLFLIFCALFCQINSYICAHSLVTLLALSCIQFWRKKINRQRFVLMICTKTDDATLGGSFVFFRIDGINLREKAPQREYVTTAQETKRHHY